MLTSPAPKASVGLTPSVSRAGLSRPAPPASSGLINTPSSKSSSRLSPYDPSNVPIFKDIFNLGTGFAKGFYGTLGDMVKLFVPKRTKTQIDATLESAGLGKPIGVEEQIGAIAEGVSEFVVGGEAIDGLKAIPIVAKAINVSKYGNLAFDVLKGTALFSGKTALSGGSGAEIAKSGIEGGIPFGIVSSIPAATILGKIGRGSLAGISEAIISKLFGETDRQTLLNSSIAFGLTTVPPIVNDNLIKNGVLNGAFDKLSETFSSIRGKFNPARITDENVLKLFEDRQKNINWNRATTQAMVDRFVSDVPDLSRREVIHRALDNPTLASGLNPTEKNWYDNLRNYYDSRGQELSDMDLIKGIVDNYAPRVVDIPETRAGFRKSRATVNMLDELGNVVSKKKYLSISDLEAAGFKMKTLDAAELFQAHSLSTAEALQTKLLMEELKLTKLPDERPAYIGASDRTFKSVEGDMTITGSVKGLGLEPIETPSVAEIEKSASVKSRQIQAKIDSLEGQKYVKAKTAEKAASSVAREISDIKTIGRKTTGELMTTRLESTKAVDVGGEPTKTRELIGEIADEQASLIAGSNETADKKISELKKRMVEIQNNAAEKASQAKIGNFYQDQFGREFYGAGDAKIPNDYSPAQGTSRGMDFYSFHPDVRPIVEAQFASGARSETGRLYTKLLQAVRRVKFLTPNVHLLNLLRNELSTKSFMELFPSIINANNELLTNPEFQKRLADSGIELFRWEKTANQSFESLDNTKFKLPKKLSGVYQKVFGNFFNATDKFLFQYVGDGVNASVAKTIYDVLNDNKDLTREQINKLVGDIANNLSGQVPKYTIGTVERNLSKILLAPRWNISNFRIYLRDIGIGFPKSWTPEMMGAATDIYQKFTMNAFSRLFLLSQYINYSTTKTLTGKGDFTWNNPISSPLDVVKKISPVVWINRSSGKYYTLNPYGYLSDGLKVIHSVITRDFSDLLDMANSKVHPVIKEVAQQAANTDFFTKQPIRQSWQVYSSNWISRNVLDSLIHAGIEFLPIGGTNIFAIPQKGQDAFPEVIRATGQSVSTYNPSSKYFDALEIRKEIKQAVKNGDTGRARELEQTLINREKNP